MKAKTQIKKAPKSTKVFPKDTVKIKNTVKQPIYIPLKDKKVLILKGAHEGSGEMQGITSVSQKDWDAVSDYDQVKELLENKDLLEK